MTDASTLLSLQQALRRTRLNDISGLSSLNTKDKSEIQDTLKQVIQEMGMWKEGFQNPFVSGLIEFLRKKENKKNRDILFYEMAKILGSRLDFRQRQVPKTVARQQLIQFIYGDPKTLETPINIGYRTSKFDNVIFLAIITANSLLNADTQKKTFDEIMRQINFKTGIFAASKQEVDILNNARKIQRDAKGKKSEVRRNTTQCRKDKSRIGERILNVNCDIETWAKIYAEFPFDDLANAVNKIIFD